MKRILLILLLSSYFGGFSQNRKIKVNVYLNNDTLSRKDFNLFYKTNDTLFIVNDDFLIEDKIENFGVEICVRNHFVSIQNFDVLAQNLNFYLNKKTLEKKKGKTNLKRKFFKYNFYYDFGLSEIYQIAIKKKSNTKCNLKF